MTEKKLSPLAFWLLLAGIVVAVCFLVYSIVIVILTMAGVGLTSFGVLEIVSSFTDVQGLDTAKDILKYVFYGIAAVVALAFLIVIIVYASFFSKIMKNRVKPLRQGYIIGLLVISVIYLLLNVSSLFSGDWYSLIGLAGAASIVAGAIIQILYKDTPANTTQVNPPSAG